MKVTNNELFNGFEKSVIENALDWAMKAQIEDLNTQIELGKRPIYTSEFIEQTVKQIIDKTRNLTIQQK